MTDPLNNGLTFEENIDIINKVIYSKKDFWRLDCINYMDFSDVAQIIRRHINEKWNSYDPTKPLANWVAKVSNNQIKNLIRNHYGRLTPPCNKCPFNNEENLCGFTASGFKDDGCLKYKKWSKNRMGAYYLKRASPLDSAEYNVSSIIDFNMEKSADKFHEQMLASMNSKTQKAYRYLFMENLTDEEVAQLLGFKSSESRSPGYKQLANIKNKILAIAKIVIKDFDIIY